MPSLTVRTGAGVAALTALVVAAPSVAAAPSAARSARAETAALQSRLQRAPASRLKPVRRVRAVRRSHDVSAVFTDAAYDNEAGLAPDIQAISVTHAESTDSLVVTTTLGTNYLVDGDFVAWYLDTDGNPATGAAVFTGADLAIALTGNSYGPNYIGASRYDAATQTWVTTTLSGLAGREYGAQQHEWTAPLASLGIGRPVTVHMHTAALYAGSYDTYFDFAPEPGQAGFAFTTAAPPAPPPPPPAPVVAPAPAPVPTPTPAVSVAATDPACPGLRGRQRSLTRQARTLRVRIGRTRAPAARRALQRRLSRLIAQRNRVAGQIQARC